MTIRRGGLVAASAVVSAFALSACGGFDSAASGEHLIKDVVKKASKAKVTVKSVSCPGGVKQKVGTTYDCRVVLHDSTTGKDHPGTITVHIISGNKVEVTPPDFHIQ